MRVWGYGRNFCSKWRITTQTPHMLGPVWDPFGTIAGPFRTHCGAIVGPFWDLPGSLRFFLFRNLCGAILEPLRDVLGTIAGPGLDLSGPFRDSFGANVGPCALQCRNFKSECVSKFQVEWCRVTVVWKYKLTCGLELFAVLPLRVFY